MAKPASRPESLPCNPVRMANAGFLEASPGVATRLNCCGGICSVSGSRMPACNNNPEDSESAHVCSMRTCGVHTQRLPAHEKAGSPRVAYEVGERGEKNGE